MIAAASHSSSSVMEQVGPNIIHHVSNSDISHPIIHLPTLFGIDFKEFNMLKQKVSQALKQQDAGE